MHFKPQRDIGSVSQSTWESLGCGRVRKNPELHAIMNHCTVDISRHSALVSGMPWIPELIVSFLPKCCFLLGFFPTF